MAKRGRKRGTGRKKGKNAVKSNHGDQAAPVDAIASLKTITAILRHDLHNDLTVIAGCLEVYRKTGKEGLLDRAIETVKKSVSLIKTMTELEQLLLQDKPLVAMDLGEVLTRVTGHYRDSGAAIIIEGGGVVLADSALDTVIDNLVRNAITHGNAGTVTIAVLDKRDCVEVQVADRGPGIPDDIIDRIFDPGFSTRGDHMGLGLSIVRQTMHRYGGRVTVTGNHPRGTVAVLEFQKVPD